MEPWFLNVTVQLSPKDVRLNSSHEVHSLPLGPQWYTTSANPVSNRITYLGWTRNTGEIWPHILVTHIHFNGRGEMDEPWTQSSMQSSDTGRGSWQNPAGRDGCWGKKKCEYICPLLYYNSHFSVFLRQTQKVERVQTCIWHNFYAMSFFKIIHRIAFCSEHWFK